MTVDERFEQLERKTQRLEKRNKRLTVALTMTVVAMCAVVTVAAKGEKHPNFDTVTARIITVTNKANKPLVVLGNNGGNGTVITSSPKGILVELGATVGGNGTVTTYQPNGKDLVRLSATADNNGGFIQVFNKTGEGIVDMGADEYGNGLVGAWNRKGKGRTLQPGP